MLHVELIRLHFIVSLKGINLSENWVFDSNFFIALSLSTRIKIITYTESLQVWSYLNLMTMGSSGKYALSNKKELSKSVIDEHTKKTSTN